MDIQLQKEGFSFWHRYYLRSQQVSESKAHSFRSHSGVYVDKNYNYNLITDLIVILSLSIEREKTLIPVKYQHRTEKRIFLN